MSKYIDTLRAKIRRHRQGARIMTSVERAIGLGWRIEPNVALHEDKTCCALGAVNLEEEDFAEAAITTLNWSYERAWAFAYGFDDYAWRRAKIEMEIAGTDISRRRRSFDLGRLVRKWVDRIQPKAVVPA
jgi:hypothetical protein